MEKAVYRLLFEVEDNYWWQKGRHLIARQLLEMDKTLPRDSSKILDAGCGTGGWLKVLKDDFWVTGLDISKEALHFCAERKLDRLVNGDVASLPYKDNTFDLITSFDVLYHKDVSSELATLKEFLRVLKPNGRIFLNFAAYRFLFSYRDELAHVKDRYTALRVRRLLRKADFKVLRVSYWNTFLFPLAVLTALMKRRARKGDVSLPPLSKIVNTLMFKILALEAIILKALNLPFGLSVCCLAKKE